MKVRSVEDIWASLSLIEPTEAVATTLNAGMSPGTLPRPMSMFLTRTGMHPLYYARVWDDLRFGQSVLPITYESEDAIDEDLPIVHRPLNVIHFGTFALEGSAFDGGLFGFAHAHITKREAWFRRETSIRSVFFELPDPSLSELKIGSHGIARLLGVIATDKVQSDAIRQQLAIESTLVR